MLSGESTLVHEPARNVSLLFDVIWDRDHFDRRAGLAAGLEAGTNVATQPNTIEVTQLFSLSARWYIVPDHLALAAYPARLDVGAKKDDTWKPFADVGSQGGIVVMPFGGVEIGIDSPRFSWVHLDRAPGTNVGLRLGFTSHTGVRTSFLGIDL